MKCFITQTGSFLPGQPVPNDQIEKYLGRLDDEAEVKKTVLKMNGITSRHYAQDANQNPTHDVYDLACEAIEDCLSQSADMPSVPATLLTGGTTYSPLSGPGISSVLHSRLQQRGLISHSMELGSHAGICTSSASALLMAIRAVGAGEHDAAISVGTEHPSEILKSSVIRPVDDRDAKTDLRRTQWFMSVFLRFMLSDGAGAFLLEREPKAEGVSFEINWTHARSFAHEAPLCMKLENDGVRLSQDISILSKYLMPTARKFSAEAMAKYDDDLSDYKVVLPHLSSFFFRRKTERIMQEFCSSDEPVAYWTNLATAGNTGSASIYIMLDHYAKHNAVSNGDKIMLFVPESGQFNFVMVSLTAVVG